MVVSLLKWEGLVFGATVAAACTLGFRHLRARRAVRRWAPLSVFVPALLHLGWDLLHGVAPSNYQDTPWHLVVAQWPARLHAVVDETWHLLQVEGYTRCHAVVWAGVAGALVAGGWAVTRGLPDRVGRLALGLAALFTVFTFGVLTLSPFDPAWHAGTAADRLLLPAGAFALMAALAVVARCGAANASDGREDRARDATSPRPAGGVVPSRSPSPPSS